MIKNIVIILLILLIVIFIKINENMINLAEDITDTHGLVNLDPNTNNEITTISKCNKNKQTNTCAGANANVNTDFKIQVNYGSNTSLLNNDGRSIYQNIDNPLLHICTINNIDFNLIKIEFVKSNLTYNNNIITKNNIQGCKLSALNNLSLKNKIQPFIKKTYTIIYFYKSSSSSINCTSVASLPARTILNPLYYDSIINSANILPLMKQFLNRGVPIRCGINYSSNINKPKSFSKYFGRAITNKKIFPSVSDDAIITDPSYDPKDKTPISHVITICGYSDFLVGDGSTGVFKIINSWGKKVGVNGYGFISYNNFFLPISNGGMTRQLIAFE